MRKMYVILLNAVLRRDMCVENLRLDLRRFGLIGEGSPSRAPQRESGTGAPLGK